MTDGPIIFSAPMVNALLEGRKTQTRRVLSDAPIGIGWHCDPADTPSGYRFVAEGGAPSLPCQVPYAVGDHLYVRERLYVIGDGIRYGTDTGDNSYCFELDRHHVMHKGRDLWLHKVRDDQRAAGIPSIHMPRWASRLTLLVTDVRVQRVNDISCADAIAEGVETEDYYDRQDYFDCVAPPGSVGRPNPRDEFEWLWNSLHKKPPKRWEDNPWVVAVSFDVQRGNIDDVA